MIKMKVNETFQSVDGIKRLDAVNGRHYYNMNDEIPDPKPSVTTVIDSISKGYAFAKWLGDSLSYKHAMQYANLKAAIGTVVHAMAEYQLRYPDAVMSIEEFINPKSDLYVDTGVRFTSEDKDSISKCLMGLFQFIKDNEIVVEALEIQMWHKDVPFSGTCDLVCKGKIKSIGGRKKAPNPDKTYRYLIDFKTGNDYKTHQLQLIFYKILFQKIYKKRINKIATLYIKDTWNKKPTYTLKEYDYDPKLAKTVVDLYKWINDVKGNTFNAKMRKEYPDTFSLLTQAEGVYNGWN